MALTIKIMRSAVPGDRKENVCDLTMDNRYTAGGYPIVPADLGLSQIETLAVNGVGSGFLWEWGVASGKLQAWKITGTGLVEAAATDLNGITVRVIARGRQ